jgi:hypothetical protein
MSGTDGFALRDVYPLVFAKRRQPAQAWPREEPKIKRSTGATRQRLAGIRQLRREVDRILELISTGLASPYVPNTIIRQMLRPFRRNDIRTTLRTLIDRHFTHGRFLHFRFSEFIRVAWQCCDRLIIASPDAWPHARAFWRGVRRDALPLACGVSLLGNMCDRW